MKVKINGEDKEFDQSMSLKELAILYNLNPEKIVIEYNLEIPSKEEFEQIFIKDGDKIELIHFVGGG